MRPMSIARKLRFSLIVLLICLGLAEIALRMINPQFVQFSNTWYRLHRYAAWNDHDLRPNARVNLQLHDKDGKTIFDYQVQTNSLAMRCSARNEAQSNVIQKTEKQAIVHCIGDSYTFGWGVEYEQSYPAVLGQMLGPSYKVLNLGDPSFGLIAAAEKSRRVGEIEPPDTIIYWFTDGDFKDDDDTLATQRNEWLGHTISELKHSLCSRSYVACAPWGLALQRWNQRNVWSRKLPPGGSNLQRSDLYEWLSAKIIREAAEQKVESAGAKQATLVELARLHDYCQQRSIKLVVILTPNSTNERLVFNEAQRLGIQLVYIASFAEWVIPDDFHFNAEGNRVLSRFVRDEVFAKSADSKKQ